MSSLFSVAATIAALALVALALLDQLVRDPRQRDWHGSVLGVPYDFRAPTVERLRQRLWATGSSQILVPAIFGVGWAVNLGRLLGRFRTAATS